MTKNIDKRIIDKGFHTGYEVDYVTIQKSDYEYLKEQAERVQELEKQNEKNYWIGNGIKLENLKLEEQNKRYREAREIIEQVYKENYVRNANTYGYEDGYLDGLDTAIGIIDKALEDEE